MDFNAAVEGSPYDDIPTRPMRVKVLYSFDAENKNNCLARFPNTLQIPAVAIDETLQVGVIELGQCIRAIVAASPDLLSRLFDGDYTIYAFDYSEYDTPLVGQGMLSAALATTTPALDAEKTMITGRVCKNVPALFSNGVKETLEVKLRLVPVPRTTQNIAIREENGRGGSPAMSGGFDPNAWSASVHQQRPHPPNDYFAFDAQSSSGDALVDDIFGLGSGISGSDSGQQVLGGVGIAQTPSDPVIGFNPAFATDSHSAPGSRSGSPMMGPETSARNDTLRHHSFSAHTPNFTGQSRPGSRDSLRGEVQQYDSQRQFPTQSGLGQNSQSQTEVYYNEDGQPRKRVKVTQTDWRGKSSFGSKSGDLRVTAATAASMHMHRPIAKRPSAPGADLEPPPRVPTPVPQLNSAFQHRRMQPPVGGRSLLRQASAACSDIMSDFEQLSDAIISSPEDNSPDNSINAEGTPIDIPSSPPVFSNVTQPQASSPGLPTFPPPRMADSGYMSERGFSSNVVDSFEDDENGSPDAQDYDTAAQYRPRGRQSRPLIKTEGSASGRPSVCPSDATPSEMDIRLELPGDMNQLPQKMLLNLPPGRGRDGSQGPRHPKIEPPLSRRSSLALPPNVDPSLPISSQTQDGQRKPLLKRRSMKRSQTYNESEAESPAPSDTEAYNRPRGPKRSGSGAPRRVVIQQRLENAVANGEMPQFCSHCGAIETPTWRRLYVKHVDGKPSPLDAAEGEGETIGVENLESDDNGEVTRFVIRKSMKKTKDSTPGEGFKDLMVCNPCGLWFNKFRNMRPSDKWGRKSTTRRRRQNTEGGVSAAADGPDLQSDAFCTDQFAPDDGTSYLATTGFSISDAGNTSGSNQEPQRAPVRRQRACSMQPQETRRASLANSWNASQLSAALTREVQSSPVRFGSQASPIEVEDLTPKPIRRLLFPSPRKDGEVRSLDDNGQVSLNATTSYSKGSTENILLSPKAALGFGDVDLNVFEAFTGGKENMEPPLDVDGDDHFAGLFDGSPTTVFKTPRKTPSKASPRSLCKRSQLLRTPTTRSQTRKPLTPSANAANNANMVANAVANDFMTSPTSPRYFLRSTPSRQERTPGRLNANGISNASPETSPFSRHLAQMLSDANESTAFTSPSRHFDFNDLPALTTPGKQMDWSGIDEILSSEFAVFEPDRNDRPTGGRSGNGSANERADSEQD